MVKNNEESNYPSQTDYFYFSFWRKPPEEKQKVLIKSVVKYDL